MNRRSLIKKSLIIGGGAIVFSEESIVKSFGLGTERMGYNNGLSKLVVSNNHPRIFIRHDDSSVGMGITVGYLKERHDNPAYESWASFDIPINGYSSLLPKAMSFLLTGNKKEAQSVFEFLKNHPFKFGEYTSAADSIYTSALAFDWIRNGISQSQANIILPMLIQGGDFLKKLVEEPAINHNYTVVSLLGVTMVALAIYGENDTYSEISLKYMDSILELLEGKGKLLDTFKAKRGIWTEGNHYTPYVVFESFLMTLKALTSATDRDYFALIDRKYDHFTSEMAKFLIANFRPDLTLERIGDVTERYVPVSSTMLPIIAALAGVQNKDTLRGQIQSFGEALIGKYKDELVPEVYNWMMLTNYERKEMSNYSYTTMPLAMRLGKGVYEHITMRNNWGENGTLITMQSGWHFTDHQHFDKGSFLIYHNGALAVDAGAYSEMYEPSWSNYSTRTLAHNCVLVRDPDEEITENHRKIPIFPDGGQRVIRGFQSQTSWQEYLKVKDEHNLDTAKVDEFGFSDDYQYVKSNLTKAYGKNIEFMGRQLLYFPKPDFLIVRDRVITNKPTEKYWLLHFQDRPEVDGKIPESGVNDFGESNVVSLVSNTDKEIVETDPLNRGKLFIKPILPLEKKISVIGGSRYEYYNRFAKKNFPPEREFPESRETGKWRMETVSKQPETDTTILHAMEISTAVKKEMVPTNLVLSFNGELNGVQFCGKEKDFVGLFNGKEGRNDGNIGRLSFPVRYMVKSEKNTQHVLTGLPGNIKVTISINGEYQSSPMTSDEGIIVFEDDKTDMRVVTIEEV